MNSTVPNIRRVNTTFIVLIVIMACIGSTALFVVFGSTYWLHEFLAMILLVLAIILTIRQKQFSLYSLALVVSGILFLVSGVVENQYDVIVSPLPVVKQIEFSKLMRPLQVSRGLSNVSFGFLYFLISFAEFRSDRLSERFKGKPFGFLLLVFAVVGLLFSILGITSIIDGLSKL